MNNTLKIKVKKLHPDAVVPRYAKPGDAGLDLTIVESKYDAETRKQTVKFGLAFEIPPGYVGLIFPRSSIHKTGLSLSNCVGVIDSGYRGEVSAMFYANTFATHLYNTGDRCAQMIIMPYPQVELVEADELSTTERGTNGFGSTGA